MLIYVACISHALARGRQLPLPFSRYGVECAETPEVPVTLCLAQDRTVRVLRDRARTFFVALQGRDFDAIWHHQISRRSAELLASAVWPAYAEQKGTLGELLRDAMNTGNEASVLQGLAFAFHQDTEEIRSGFFHGIADAMGRTLRWHEFRDPVSVFVDGDCAVLIADADPLPAMLTFVHEPEFGWLVDLESWLIFGQRGVTAKLLYTAARAAEREGASRSAFALFELTAALWDAHQRLRRLLLDNVAAKEIVVDARIGELEHDAEFALLARHEVLVRLANTAEVTCDIDMSIFMRKAFAGYSDITAESVDEADLRVLITLSDDVLRAGVARCVVGVDQVVAQREARKPHGPAEVADMELPLRYEGRLVYLCMPFKSGREIRGASVPVEVAYQLIRPFVCLPNAIVVFVTAKPCSQYLLNYVKQARATQGWAIEVLEHRELAALLKLNGILTASYPEVPSGDGGPRDVASPS